MIRINMKLELKYIPEVNPCINIYKDLQSCLNQLSDCYNDIIKDLQDKIKGLEIERNTLIKGLKDNNIEGLKNYFGIE